MRAYPLRNRIGDAESLVATVWTSGLRRQAQARPGCGQTDKGTAKKQRTVLSPLGVLVGGRSDQQADVPEIALEGDLEPLQRLAHPRGLQASAQPLRSWLELM